MASIEILFLSKEDIDSLELDLQEVMDAIALGLKVHGEKKVIMPPKITYPSPIPKNCSTS